MRRLWLDLVHQKTLIRDLRGYLGDASVPWGPYKVYIGVM